MIVLLTSNAFIPLKILKNKQKSMYLPHQLQKKKKKKTGKNCIFFQFRNINKKFYQLRKENTFNNEKTLSFKSNQADLTHLHPKTSKNSFAFHKLQHIKQYIFVANRPHRFFYEFSINFCVNLSDKGFWTGTKVCLCANSTADAKVYNLFKLVEYL